MTAEKSARKKYRTISVPEVMYDMLGEFVDRNEALGYASRSDVTKQSIREKIEKEDPDLLEKYLKNSANRKK